MNAEMMKRVVRAIADRSQADLDRLADKLVASERKTGHVKLADQLEAILKSPRPRIETQKSSSTHVGRLTELPVSRRNGESLATLFAPETLEHHMVLPAATEERFARIEKEYTARDRLAKYGLKPRKTILLHGPPGCGKSLGRKATGMEHRVALDEGTLRFAHLLVLWRVRSKSWEHLQCRQAASLRPAVG